MKNIKMIMIVSALVVLCVFTGCGSSAEIKAETENTRAKHTNITSLQVEPYGFNSFIIRYSNLIYEYEGKKFKLPIFQGTFGDVSYDDCLNYCYSYGFLDHDSAESAFALKCRRGEIKKMIMEFVAFYKSNILKDVDIEKPLVEYPGHWEIYYEFKMNGVTCHLSISYLGSFNSKAGGKLIDCIAPDENVVDPSFYYNFHIAE